MGESRGKKAKKATWQMQLGLKELVFSGLAVAGLVMMSFALGTLAGRGDIYRVLHNWGLLGPDNSRAFQSWQPPPPPAPPSTPVATLSSPAPQEPPAQGNPAPPQTTAAENTPPPAPVKGDIAAPPHPLQAKKKLPQQHLKANEEKLEKIRREVASKLKFQNSLDLSAAKAATAPGKAKKGDDREAPKPSTTQVLVAKFRDAGQARGKLAQMQKQGEKVYLKEGKDSEGNYFAIYRTVTASPPKSPHAAQKQGSKKPKTENQTAKSPNR